MSIEAYLFFLFALIAIASAVLMVMQRNPVMSALDLIANFFCIAALYLLLKAQFLAVIQIIVYTGAIMVLVLFVIMLLNLGDEKRLSEQFDMKKAIGSILVAGFLLEMLYLFGSSDESVAYANLHPESGNIGTVENIGGEFFRRFLLPFEIASLLLLAAIIGAVVLAKKRL
ncbi:MAG: NADH-quinone oxidoreductase subunit J [Ignavibacteriae bacterium]|nr:NADH-quinone oxidoreductase subunit J [Ignavibacteriota bacterium]